MKPLIIKTTPTFDRQAKKCLSEEAKESLFDYLELNPEAGALLSGTGGVRKLRWKTGKNNKGKRGGVRVLYHYSNEGLMIVITLYSKSDKENISDQERHELRQLVPRLVEQYKEDLL